MTISYILAMDEARGIGVDNRLPWHLPADLAYFRKKTTGSTILMGRKTYDSIGKPLPKRTNVILTRDASFQAEGCTVIRSVEEAAQVYGRGGRNEEEELFVIGGAEVFQLLMPYADRLYITEIAHRFEADTFFPELEPLEWREVSRERGVKDEKNPYDYDFVVYERVRKP
ncbi:dihydrofolate reductase [Paenibacillus validus]|uniref:Dihydrofolate reductase n=1 Tax=Paenibacillus validus TaxID=44253 RepID=A0A7X2ZDI5_9BACL|nr:MULTISPECIES: dihydrofolate reductase [Paenibacillus]MED4599510.1 dihydrofolate reductase [Paenibacillus validus]MED4607077.1 dihydrofolate reductase [Paenibacillus validus]MUG72166.1 dihydrofolate reductase [Paenibacillus validus]